MFSVRPACGRTKLRVSNWPSVAGSFFQPLSASFRPLECGKGVAAALTRGRVQPAEAPLRQCVPARTALAWVAGSAVGREPQPLALQCERRVIQRACAPPTKPQRLHEKPSNTHRTALTVRAEGSGLPPEALPRVWAAPRGVIRQGSAWFLDEPFGAHVWAVAAEDLRVCRRRMLTVSPSA